MRFVQGMVSLILILVVAGCGGTVAGRLPTSPEAAIKRVHTACVAGEYEQILPLFKSGKETWDVSPSTAKGIIDKVCHNSLGQLAEYIDISQSDVRGEGAFYQTITYATSGRSDWGKTLRWEFIKVKEGWLIVSL